MSDPSNSAAAVHYRAAGSGAGSAGPPNTTSKQTAVPHFKLYKAGRSEELLAYRHLVRVLAMNHGPNIPKQFTRILEDVRELAQVDEARHRLELHEALSDPALVAIRKSGVLQDRAPYFDGVTDVPPSLSTTDQEDDGGAVVSTSFAQGGPGSKKGPVGGAGGRGGNKKIVGGGGRPSTPQPQESALQKEVKSVGDDIRQLCRSLVVMPAGAQRNDLLQKLQQRRETLEQLKGRRVEELGGVRS